MPTFPTDRPVPPVTTTAFGADDTSDQTGEHPTQVDDLEHWLRDLRTGPHDDLPGRPGGAVADDGPAGNAAGKPSTPAVYDQPAAEPQPTPPQTAGRHRAKD
jgi:hypothetical protein